MKVKLLFGQKAVVWSLSKLNIESKNFFYKSCSVWYAVWECQIKAKVKLLFGHKAVISSLSKQSIEQKKIFCKSCSVWYTIWECGVEIEKFGQVIKVNSRQVNLFWHNVSAEKTFPTLSSCEVRLVLNPNPIKMKLHFSWKSYKPWKNFTSIY